jgi:hypothetical protein
MSTSPFFGGVNPSLEGFSLRRITPFSGAAVTAARAIGLFFGAYDLLW